MISDTLAIVLGGGQGARLFPLTATRSKPAVPIGGKYRLIDLPVSGCLHADIRRIFVLTQFNSASLNRHISNTYRLDLFSGGFVEILAAEQTPDNQNWFQGTADAVRQAARHFSQHHGRLLPGARRRSHLPGGLPRVHRDAQAARRRHHDRGAADRSRGRDPDGHLRVRPRRPDRRLRGEAQARSPGRDRPQRARGRHVRGAHRRAAVHGVDGHLRLLAPGAARPARAASRATTSGASSSRGR